MAKCKKCHGRGEIFSRAEYRMSEGPNSEPGPGGYLRCLHCHGSGEEGYIARTESGARVYCGLCNGHGKRWNGSHMAKCDCVKDCFIATAVYESPDSLEVQTLRRFRDEVLLKHWWGAVFVKWYYHISPRMAQMLEKSNYSRKIIQHVLLNPIVAYLKKHKYE